ncbi:MAG: hypothetical protein IJI74_03985 [Firmicutes bacterium]|nr:hypothetical protein [Bacillota bacterium]
MIDYIKQSIAIDRHRLAHYEKLSGLAVNGRLNCKWDYRRSKSYYYYKGPDDDREHMVKEEPNAIIWKIQEKRFAKAMISVLRNNIEIKQKLVSQLLSDLESDVMEKLPKAYRPNVRFKTKPSHVSGIHQSENPFKREQLTIQTSFGLFVRTKSEMIIAELLHSLGITFYYEKALTLKVQRFGTDGHPYWTSHTYYPDFTIELPDGRIIYWEHKGMMSDINYVKNNNQKCVDYNMNGIFQSHNYIVTEEGPNNRIDFEGIKKIAADWLL